MGSRESEVGNRKTEKAYKLLIRIKRPGEKPGLLFLKYNLMRIGR